MEVSDEKPTTIDFPGVSKAETFTLICKFCHDVVENNTKSKEYHISLHEDNNSLCSICYYPLPSDIEDHFRIMHPWIHPDEANEVYFHLDDFIFEKRIVFKEMYSKFRFVEQDVRPLFNIMKHNFNQSHDPSELVKFGENSSGKYFWNCVLCKSKFIYKTCSTISLRVYALNHLTKFHKNIVSPDFLHFEWEMLCLSTQFDFRELIEISRFRTDIKNRSYLTYYTLNLEIFPNGSALLDSLKHSFQLSSENNCDIRFCLECMSLIKKRSLNTHFKSIHHERLEAQSYSCAFFETEREKIEKNSDENDIELIFPRELFAYCKIFKTLKCDVFKWKCSICPSYEVKTFITFVVLRMHALKHIEEHHCYLFTDEFFEFEWSLIRNEMQIGFDIRKYKPEIEDPRNPNDYCLKQQYFFTPKEFISSHRICKICYESVNVKAFLRHIKKHGFEIDQPNLRLKDVQMNEISMEREKFKPIDTSEEPLDMLSYEGYRLARTVRKIANNACSFEMSFSEKKEKPQRRSAINAGKLMIDSIQTSEEHKRYLEENLNISPSSSSYSESDSEEEKRRNLKRRASSGAICSKQTYYWLGENQNLNEMEPKKLRKLIRKEANKRGLQWNDIDSSDSEFL